jgi:hypothetical protein
MFTRVFIVFLDDYLLSWLGWNTHDNRQPSKETISTNFCEHTLCLLMIGGGYARNMEHP